MLIFLSISCTICRINPNFNGSEAKTLRNLATQKHIITQKADKENTLVILEKEYNIDKMKKLSSGTSKFERLEILPDKLLNFVINSQGKIKFILNRLHDNESLPDMLYKKPWPVGCRPGILYGQAKALKPVSNNCPTFRPVLDAINTPSSNFAKFLLPILSPLTINEYNVKDSFAFAKEIIKTYCNYITASSDVKSLFTNVPLEEKSKIVLMICFLINLKRII